MGWPKATLPFGAETLLARMVHVLRQVVQPVVVVAAATQSLPVLPDDVMVARDRQEDRGPLEGLAVGLHTIAPWTEAAYVTGCDAPLLRPAFVQRMIDLLGTHDLVVPRDGRFYHPLAAVYRTRIVAHVQRLLDAQRLRPLFLLAQANALVVPVDRLRDVDPHLASLQNVNCLADYLSALQSVGYAMPDHIEARRRAQPEDGDPRP